MAATKPHLFVEGGVIGRVLVSDKVFTRHALSRTLLVPERTAYDLLDFSVVYINTRSDLHLESSWDEQ